jgi:hypothetical protein
MPTSSVSIRLHGFPPRRRRTYGTPSHTIMAAAISRNAGTTIESTTEVAAAVPASTSSVIARPNVKSSAFRVRIVQPPIGVSESVSEGACSPALSMTE